MPDTSRRTLLKNKAYAEIKGRILHGHYTPGTFLAERGLASELGMSKTPVQAAISRLESEGFLTVSPQQGIVVRELPLGEILDHFDIRIALETFTVRRLAGRLTPAQLDRLQHNLADQEIHIRAHDVPAYIESDAAFHLILAEILDNQEILRAMSRQRDKLHRIVSRVFEQDGRRMRSSTEEHTAIFEALRAGDEEAAVAHMETHLTYGKRALVTM